MIDRLNNWKQGLRVSDLPNNIQRGEPGRKSIDKLLLDDRNPRFGELDRETEQSRIVDLIVEKFGIEDILGSMALNGFFAAEPLVCARKANGDLVVKEGNRRLCACIILTKDARAHRQAELTKRAAEQWRRNGMPPIEPAPILIFDEGGAEADKMLAYLGVRHISAAQPWDSYAKASWVAQITDNTELSVSKVSEMIGDQHLTVVRLLEGYHFIRQLIDSGKFSPENSIRKGGGSVPEYPFSWVYTMLGFKAARTFCGLGEISEKANPIKLDKIDNAAFAVAMMFGDKSTARNSAVVDSRQLGDLARAFAEPDKVAELKNGKDLITVLNITKPLEEKLDQNLNQISNLLRDLVSDVVETPPSFEAAHKHLPRARRTRELAIDLFRRLKKIVDQDSDSDVD